MQIEPCVTLKYLREKYGLTQVMLAKEVGVSQAVISLLEVNRMKFPQELKIKIAVKYPDFLTPEKLIKEVEEREEKAKSDNPVPFAPGRLTVRYLQAPGVFKKIRKDFLLSQKKLAELMGVSHVYLSRTENGKCRLSADSAQKALDVFNKPITLKGERTVKEFRKKNATAKLKEEDEALLKEFNSVNAYNFTDKYFEFLVNTKMPLHDYLVFYPALSMKVFRIVVDNLKTERFNKDVFLGRLYETALELYRKTVLPESDGRNSAKGFVKTIADECLSVFEAGRFAKRKELIRITLDKFENYASDYTSNKHRNKLPSFIKRETEGLELLPPEILRFFLAASSLIQLLTIPKPFAKDALDNHYRFLISAIATQWQKESSCYPDSRNNMEAGSVLVCLKAMEEETVNHFTATLLSPITYVMASATIKNR